jgi:hypothetical protein
VTAIEYVALAVGLVVIGALGKWAGSTVVQALFRSIGGPSPPPPPAQQQATQTQSGAPVSVWVGGTTMPAHAQPQGATGSGPHEVTSSPEQAASPSDMPSIIRAFAEMGCSNEVVKMIECVRASVDETRRASQEAHQRHEAMISEVVGTQRVLADNQRVLAENQRTGNAMLERISRITDRLAEQDQLMQQLSIELGKCEGGDLCRRHG